MAENKICNDVRSLLRLDGLRGKFGDDRGERSRITYEYIRDFLENKKNEVLNSFFSNNLSIDELNELRIAGRIILELIGNLEMVRDADRLDRDLNNIDAEVYNE